MHPVIAGASALVVAFALGCGGAGGHDWPIEAVEDAVAQAVADESAMNQAYSADCTPGEEEGEYECVTTEYYTPPGGAEVEGDRASVTVTVAEDGTFRGTHDLKGEISGTVSR